jgi:alkylhydroperoxidase/carboxymuconolactone decarboxylase family protein YurZ
MQPSHDSYRALTQAVSSELASLRSSTPDVMKAFSDLGRAATADGALDKKTKELIALALSVAARCDPCIGARKSMRPLPSPPTWAAALR